MTYEALMKAIQRIATKRKENALDDKIVAECNAKLEKLYAIKFTMLEQMGGVV